MLYCICKQVMLNDNRIHSPPALSSLADWDNADVVSHKPTVDFVSVSFTGESVQNFSRSISRKL